MNSVFQGLYDTSTASTMAVPTFLATMGAALLLGLFIALTYMYRTRYTKSFVVTIIMLPAIVAVIIAMVNGNLGAGVAVAGAFSLVRFRSVPGTAKEIGTLFLAMATGLICGMGYLGYAALFTILLGLAMLILTQIFNGIAGTAGKDKVIKISMPEDLDYTSVFDDIMDRYTSRYELVSAKTTAMGSLFEIKYNATLRDPSEEKAFVDAIRCRNGNLSISVIRQGDDINAL